jgi:hypothetical protein
MVFNFEKRFNGFKENWKDIFKDQLVAKVGAKQAEQIFSQLVYIIENMPAMSAELENFWEPKDLSARERERLSLYLAYLAAEDDLFSEKEYGMLGLLDDAYLLATLYLTGPGSEKDNYQTTRVHQARALICEVLPEVTRNLDKIVYNIQHHNDWEALALSLKLDTRMPEKKKK